MTATIPALFEGRFQVTALDPGGRKFERTSRVEATSSETGASITLDVNTQLFPVSVDDHLYVCLKEHVYKHEVGTKNGTRQYRPHGQSADLDAADYAMFGTVFRYRLAGANTSIYVSFGGLLFRLNAPSARLAMIRDDMQLYLLVKRLSE